MYSKNNQNNPNNPNNNLNNPNNPNNNQNDNYNNEYTDYRSYKKKKVYHDISGGQTNQNQSQYMTQSQQQRYQQYNQQQNYYGNQQSYNQSQHYHHHHHHQQQQSYNQQQQQYYYGNQQYLNQLQQQQQVIYRNIKNNSLYNEILDQKQFTDDDLIKSVNIWIELFNSDMETSEIDLKSLIKQSYPFEAKTLMDNVISTFCIYRPEYIAMIVNILVNEIYDNQMDYRFSFPPFYAFKKLFLVDGIKEDKQQHLLSNQYNNNNNNNQLQQQQQQPLMNYTYGIGGGLVTPIQSLYTINRIIQLQDNNFIPLQILYELTCFNLIYFLKNKNNNFTINFSSSSSSSSNSKYPPKRKKTNDEIYLTISVWILDCLIRSPVTIIESYFYKLIDIHHQVSQINRLKPFKTLCNHIKQSNIDQEELETLLPIAIRNHIVSLFSNHPDSLSIDSKKVQYILHSLVPILVKYQSKFISKDYHFILIHYFSNTNNSFIHRLIHNLISLSTNDHNIIINLIEFLMNNKFENLNLQNHFLPPILQGLNEDLIKSKARLILKLIINSPSLNVILFGKNYSVNQDSDTNNNPIYFSETNNINSSKILVNLLGTLKCCSSETQNLFFSLWEDYLRNTIRDSYNVVSQFWYIKQLILHYNLFEFELKEMSKRLLLLFLNNLITQNNIFDSKVISIFQQLTFNIFYVSSLLFKNQDQQQISTNSNNNNNNSNISNNNNNIIGNNSNSNNDFIKISDNLLLVDPSIPLFLDYLQFIINKFSKNHIVYKTILKTIQQIINNITLLDSTILLKNNQLKPVNTSLSSSASSSTINDNSQNIDTTTLEIYNIQISLEFLYSLINSISINNSNQDINNDNNYNLIFNNTKEFLLKIMINNNSIRDNIMSLLVLNDIGFKTISLKLLLEIEKNSISSGGNIDSSEEESYWSSQDKIELLFTNLLEPNLFELCLEFLQIIKSSNYELIVTSLLQKLAILSENSNENLSNAIITLLEELIVKNDQLIYQILKFIQSNLFNHYGNLINNNSINSYNNNSIINNNHNSNFINRNLLILLQKLQILVPTLNNSNDNSNELIKDLISQSLKNINNNNFNIQLIQYQLISNIVFNQSKYNNSGSEIENEYHLKFYNDYIYYLIQGILSTHFSVRILCQTIIQEFINQNPQQHKKKVLDFLIYKLKSFSINSEYNNQIPLLRKSIESIQISSLLQYK